MSQSLAKILLHIVFSTKNRQEFLHDQIRNDLHLYLAEILKDLGCFAYAINGTEDHVHILCEISKKLPICDIVKKLKTCSTNWLKNIKNFNRNFYWQEGYGVFSVSASNKKIVLQYIKNQMQHHKKSTFKNEFISFLKKYEIDYDEKYLWN